MRFPKSFMKTLCNYFSITHQHCTNKCAIPNESPALFGKFQTAADEEGVHVGEGPISVPLSYWFFAFSRAFCSTDAGRSPRGGVSAW